MLRDGRAEVFEWLLDRSWRRVNCWSITVEGTVTWWCGDDSNIRERKLDYEVRVPKWFWRPLCWLRGRHDQYYSGCVFCDKPMGRKPR